MNGKNSKNTPQENKKDRYTTVTVCQIITSAIIFMIYMFIICVSAEAKEEFNYYFSSELIDTYGIVSAVKEYISSQGVWQVSGSNVVYSQDGGENEYETAQVTTAETENENLNGIGGDDLEIYQAADNASFAVLRVTTPAVIPVEGGRFTSYFGYRDNPITGEFSFHTGLDIAAPHGTKIRAAYPGTVSAVGEDDRSGKYIFLTHEDGFVTFYCHCSEIVACEGAVIRQGETIAKVGSTGWSTGPHLHFEIRKNNIRYNPLCILVNDN